MTMLSVGLHLRMATERGSYRVKHILHLVMLFQLLNIRLQSFNKPSNPAKQSSHAHACSPVACIFISYYGWALDVTEGEFTSAINVPSNNTSKHPVNTTRFNAFTQHFATDDPGGSFRSSPKPKGTGN